MGKPQRVVVVCRSLHRGEGLERVSMCGIMAMSNSSRD